MQTEINTSITMLLAPPFLGHNDPYVTEVVIRVLREGASLYGSGTTVLEGQLAELICRHVPAARGKRQADA